METGKIYINGNDFSVLKFIAENSPAGSPYIRSLQGTDKIFAKLLHIDLTTKGWKRTVSFSKIENKMHLNHAEISYHIQYKQPKKGLDLNLSINTELMVTDFQHPITAKIDKGTEWKRKNLVANLPTDFDSAFWGARNILISTTEQKDIIKNIAEKNKETYPHHSILNWEYLNGNYFIAIGGNDSITLIPTFNSNWEDEETGGMIFKTLDSDFSITAKLILTKRTHEDEQPDGGFQQSGLIIRSQKGEEENYILFTIGTGGNETAKYFVKRTVAGKSKTLVAKIDALFAYLKIVKAGKLLTLYIKLKDMDEWDKIDDYEFDWLKGKLQVGLSVMARFVGSGPKMHPDMKAIFSGVKIEK